MKLSVVGGVDVHRSKGLIRDSDATKRRNSGVETLLDG
jgi:hypothetical protein